MELRQLEYVVAAIDEAGFTRAAEVLHVAQPTLSQGIRSLEQELGVDLFDRVGRGVRPSTAGRAFEPAARRALSEASAARTAAAEVRGLRAGQLSVIALPTLVVDPLVHWIGAFRRAYPGITLQVPHAEEADAVPDFVREGRVDLGLGDVDSLPPGLEEAFGFDQELVAICPPGTQLREQVPLAELADFPLIVTPTGTSTRRIVDGAFGAVSRRPIIALEVDQREAILPLVLAGAGVSFVPLAIAQQARRAGAVVGRTRPPLRRRVGLIRRSGTPGPVLAAFLALVTPEALDHQERDTSAM